MISPFCIQKKIDDYVTHDFFLFTVYTLISNKKKTPTLISSIYFVPNVNAHRNIFYYFYIPTSNMR
jgi:hypothetical protein